MVGSSTKMKLEVVFQITNNNIIANFFTLLLVKSPKDFHIIKLNIITFLKFSTTVNSKFLSFF